MLQFVPTPLLIAGIFLLIVVFYLAGYWIRKSSILNNPSESNIDLTTINGTFLGLLGLLLAFTFSMANSRFDNRREIIIEEANNIGTAILRTDIYPDSVRSILRSHMKKYVEARIAYFASGMNELEKEKSFALSNELSKKVWDVAAGYAKVDNITTRTSELIPALNAVIDIAATRKAAGEAFIPNSIMYFLFILCFCASFLIGYDNKTKIDWIVLFIYALMFSATIYNIIDLDRPRSGLIDMDLPNQKIVELRSLFNENE